MKRNTSLSPARIALLACVNLFFGAGGVSAQSGYSADPTLGRIVLIEPKEPKGALKVGQAKGLAPVNAREGMPVRRGYLLTLAPFARASVICGDGKERALTPGLQGCPCTKPCTPDVCGIRYDGSTIGLPRGPDTDKSLFPVVISPRKTMMRSLRPTIRWSPVAGAKGAIYKVTLYAEGMKAVWSREVQSQTTLAYPDNEAPLKPGQTYKVVVTSDGLSSQQDHSPGLGFTTLTAGQSQALAAEEGKRKQLKLPEKQTRFLIANLYAARELYCEAIEQLEQLYATMKEPAVAGMLGDLYAAIGLNREAEKKYLEALGLTDADDLDGLGQIQRNLAQVYENLGIFDQAVARLNEAIKAYRRLGNKAMLKTLTKEERRLKQP